MSLLSKLFGGKPEPEAEAETYEGFRITPAPIREASGFRVAARIEAGEGESLQSHMMIRADTCATRDEAVSFSLIKARLLIDEQGARIFS